MRRLLLCACFAVSCGQPPSTANCPNFTSGGECDGTTAKFCDSSTDGKPPKTLDCTSVSGTCGMSSSFGAWCAVPKGKGCTISGQPMSGYVYCGASGPDTSLACDLEKGCVDSATACTPGMQVPYCDGSKQVVSCTPWGQPVEHDCVGLGGTGCASGACTGLTDGGTPDSGSPDSGSPDSGMPGDGGFMEAAHPTVATVVSLGGPVLTHPRVQMISWASDPQGAVADGFVQELLTTSYWSITTSEYGVGPLMAAMPVHLPDPIPSSYTDALFTQLITTNTTGASPAWGPVDTQTIYVIAIPKGVVFDDGTGDKCCTGDYDGYHDEATIGGTRVAYAVTCTCPGFDGPSETDAQQLTVVVSHELVESATDPYFQSAAGIAQSDDAHLAWTVATQGEAADMCELNTDADVIPADGTYTVQRTWSNAAALAGQNPCVPWSGVYNGTEPVMPDKKVLSYFGESWNAAVVKIPMGQTGMVDIPLFSSGPSGAWTVKAYDYSADYGGGAKLLNLSLDRETGQNGDVLHLSITPQAFDSTLHGAVFIIESTWGSYDSLSMGIVVPN
jgi:hypothetical protein